MRRIEARWRKSERVSGEISKSLANRRQRLSKRKCVRQPTSRQKLDPFADRSVLTISDLQMRQDLGENKHGRRHDLEYRLMHNSMKQQA